MPSIYNHNDLEEHTQALANTFAMIADRRNISPDDLVSLRNRVVEERGKYDADWQNDPEEKLAFDYYFCIEQLHYIRNDYDLSVKRRERLYRMATWNDDVFAIWAQVPYYDPKAFFNDEQWDNKVWTRRDLKRPTYKKKKSKCL